MTNTSRRKKPAAPTIAELELAYRQAARAEQEYAATVPDVKPSERQLATYSAKCDATNAAIRALNAARGE